MKLSGITMMTAPTDDIPVPAIRPIWLRPFIGQLLWTAVILWAIWILRFFLLFFGYGLTGDHDPEAVYQSQPSGHCNRVVPGNAVAHAVAGIPAPVRPDRVPRRVQAPGQKARHRRSSRMMTSALRH